MRRTVGLPDIESRHVISYSRPLPPAEYESLIATLRTELSDAYPHLELGGYFTDPA